jgi:hypothetical protein
MGVDLQSVLETLVCDSHRDQVDSKCGYIDKYLCWMS